MAAPAPAPHLLLLPSLGIGHMIPFTELAKRLVARGFLVSFFISSSHGLLSIARNKIVNAPYIHIVELHLSDQINPQSSESKNHSLDHTLPLILSNRTLLQGAFQKLLMSEEDENGFRLMYPPPLYIVSDFLLSWTVTMAAKLGIPRVNVECSPAYSQNLFETLWTKLPCNLEWSIYGRYIVPHQAKRTILSRSQMPPRSVIYVSFGSQSSISASQIIELALGLEASGKPFLWVLKLPASDENNPTLDGICRRTEQQGRIVSGWTDQLAILSHPSVGAFITHCGWNSTLEAICNGIPLICWPLFTEDQHFNTRFIVDEAKVGIEVVKRDEYQMVVRNEIEKSVRTMMDDDGSGDERIKSLKENSSRLKEMAKKAVSEDGSSSKNFDMFVKDILSLQNKKKDPVSNPCM